MEDRYRLLTRQFFEDPYPTLHRMRAEEPVHFFEPLRIWLLTRHDHVDAVVRDHARFSNVRAEVMFPHLMPETERGELDELIAQWSRTLWYLDPPEHTRVRTEANAAFSPHRLETLRPMVRSLVHEALAPRLPLGEVDVATELAHPVAMRTLMGLFAIPDGDRASFEVWLVDSLRLAGGAATSREAAQQVKKSARDMHRYIVAMVEERARHPGGDMVSHLLSPGKKPLSVEETTSLCLIFIAAGYLTSANQITNSVLCLLRHPRELERLRADPSLLKRAIEETLRYEPSVLTTNRLATQDIPLGGKVIHKGDLVFPVLAAANRDPAVCSDPDRFDITRPEAKHLTFSVGPHYCAGAGLVRMEIEESLSALLRLDAWRFGARPYEYPSFHLQDRAPKTLPMCFAPVS